MKKVFKSRIFAFILGALIFSGITAVSAYSIFANDIGYTPKDTTWKKSNGEDITNVKDAIDELYEKSLSNGLNYNNINYKILSFQERKQITDISLDLSKGKYVCNYSLSFYTSGNDNTINGESNNYSPLVSGCDTTNKINGISKTVAAGTSYLKNSSNTSIYTNGTNFLYTFTCDVNNSKTITVTHTTTANATTNVGTTVLMNCIEIK